MQTKSISFMYLTDIKIYQSVVKGKKKKKKKESGDLEKEKKMARMYKLILLFCDCKFCISSIRNTGYNLIFIAAFHSLLFV